MFLIYLSKHQGKIAPFVMILAGVASFSAVVGFTDLQLRRLSIIQTACLYVAISVFIAYISTGIAGFVKSPCRKTYLTLLDCLWVIASITGITIALSHDLTIGYDTKIVEFNYRLFLVLAGGVRLSKNMSELMWAA